ncbi:hypothetical protein D9M69_467580 [compost metagenome]
MVVGQRQIHHRQDHNLAIHGHRALLDLVHTEDGGLRRVDDRAGEQRTEHATVGDGEGATGHLFDGQLAFTGLLAEVGDAAFDFSQAHEFGVTQHRYNQATVAGYGNADVLVTVVDDVVAVDRGVDAREALQRLGGSLDEEGHEAQANAVVLLLEQVLVLGAQVHDRLHVDFVVGSQHGHGGLGFDQALGDLGTQAGHRDALLDAITGAEDRSLASRGSRLGSGRGGSRGVLLGLNGSNHVFLGHATALAGTSDAVRVDAILFGQLAGCRREDRVVGSRSGRSSGLGRSGSRGSSGRSSGRGTSVQFAEQFAAEDGVALVLDDFSQDAVGFRQDFHDHFVGFDVDNQLVALDRLARLLVPGSHGAVGNRFRESGGFDLDSHCSGFLSNSVSSARRR